MTMPYENDPENHAKRVVNELFDGTAAEFELQYQEYRRPLRFERALAKWDAISRVDKNGFGGFIGGLAVACYSDSLMHGPNLATTASVVYSMWSLFSWGVKYEVEKGRSRDQQPDDNQE